MGDSGILLGAEDFPMEVAAAESLQMFHPRTKQRVVLLNKVAHALDEERSGRPAGDEIIDSVETFRSPDHIQV